MNRDFVGDEVWTQASRRWENKLLAIQLLRHLISGSAGENRDHALDASQLEDRVMLSASPVVGLIVDPDQAPTVFEQTEQIEETNEQLVETSTDSNKEDFRPGESPSHAEQRILERVELTSQVELVFVDSGASDYEQLVADLLANADPQRELEVYLLENDRDGVAQISDVVAGYDELAAIHLVSHGTDNQVKLGDTWLTTSSLDRYTKDIAGWKDSLRTGADLLIYGCNLASAPDGRALTKAIGSLCGCDVASSVDDTGYRNRGGDWKLEFKTGVIETRIAFSSEVRSQWTHLMALETLRDEFSPVSYSNSNGSVLWPTSWIENDAANAGQDPASGNWKINNGEKLRIRTANAGDSIFREADLSGAGTVTFSFDVVNVIDEDDVVRVEVSGNGGGSWSTLRNYNSSNDGSFAEKFDISSFRAVNTQIRFLVVEGGDDERVRFDNVQIAYNTNGPPDITSSTTPNINENQTVVQTLTADDPDADPVAFAITGGDDQGFFSINGSDELVFDTAPDYETALDFGADNVYEVEVTADDGFAQDIELISVTVDDLNDTTPVVTPAQNFNVDEDEANGFSLGFVLATDPDTVGSLQNWTITGGNNDGIFAIDPSTGELTIFDDTNLDFESDNSYTLKVRVEDGANVSSQEDVDVDINDINEAPSITAISDQTVLESDNTGSLAFTVDDPETAAGALIVTAVSSDQAIIPDANLLINGAGANKDITVTPAVGQSGGPVTITVTVDDGINTSQELFDVTVVDRVITVTTSLDENDGDTTDILTLLASPGGTGISLREAIIATNETVVGATPDQILLPAGNYFLFGSGDNDADDGDLDINDDLDIIGAGARSTTVDAQGTDRVFHVINGTATISGITITGGNEHGGGALIEGGATLTLSDATMTGNSSDEGGAAHVHGTLNLDRVTLDNNSADDGGALYFHGADGGTLLNVTISGNTAATEGGGIWTDSIINVTHTTIADNTGTTFGGVFVSGGGDVVLTNSILDNNGSNANTALSSGDFNIDSDGTALLAGGNDQVANPLLGLLADNGGPTDTHALLVASPARDPAGLGGAPAIDQRGVTRDGAPDIGSFEVSVSNPVGPINDTDILPNQVAENAANTTSVGITALALDPDLDAVNYTLDDDAGGRFTIDFNSGVVTVANGMLLDYETATSHNITVRATSTDTSTITQFFTIDLTPVNDNSPVFTSSASVNVTENTAFVQTVVATDDDLPAQTVTYTITAGDDALFFSLNPLSGDLSFTIPPDFETKADFDANNIYEVEVTADDNAGNTTSQLISVTILPDDDSSPVFVSPAAVSVNENSTFVQTVVATDDDLPLQLVSYSISGGNDAALFSINPFSGDLAFQAAPDFENATDFDGNNVYQVEVTADDNVGNTTAQLISVTVDPINDNNPVFTSGSKGRIAENTSTVVKLTARDDDLPTQTISFSVVGGADAALFTVNAANQLKFITPPNFESPADSDFNNSYQVTVRGDDGNGGTTDQNLVVGVRDVNDNPVITSNALVSVAENTLAVLTVTSSDDDGGTPRYSIINGADGSLFDIDSATGALSWITPANFEAPDDANSNNIYVVAVRVEDGNGGFDNQVIRVLVTDSNDDPTAVNDSYVANSEEPLAVIAPGALANDSDQDGDSLTATVIVVGPTKGTVSLNSDGSFVYTPNDSTSGSDSFVYQIDDGNGGSATASVTITINAAAPPAPSTPATDPPPPEEPSPEETAPTVQKNAEPPQGIPVVPQPIGGRTPIDREKSEISTATSVTVVSAALPDTETNELVSEFPPESFRSFAGASRGGIAQTSISVLETFVAPFDANLLWNDLTDLEQGLQQNADVPFFAAGSAAGATTAFTVGYVMWTIRSGWLATSLLAQMPAWRLVDPLVVLDYLDEENAEKEDGQDDSIESMLEQQEDPPENDSESLSTAQNNNPDKSP